MSNKVIITTTSFAKEAPEIFETLAKHNLTAFCNDKGRQLDEKELQELLKVHQPCGMLAGTEVISEKTINQAGDFLKVISRVGAGWDNVDHDAAKQAGIIVCRTTGVLTQAVAELTVGLILNALRAISLHERLVRNKRWEKKMGGLLAGKVVGVVGFGAIGRRVGELLRAFGAKIIYYDPVLLPVDWAMPVPLEQLAAQSDIVTVHASGKEILLGDDHFKSMSGRNAILVNTARGSLVDENSLYQFLKDGKIAFACLDVFSQEPYRGPLCELENVILTPHIGSYAREARKQMEEKAVENLINGLKKARVL